MIGIYKITNKLNGKVYIGQSKNIERRWKDHLKAKDNFPIHRAIRKYGKEAFTFEVILECSLEDLNLQEQLYIKIYDSVINGYNCTWGGGVGSYRSDSTRKRMSDSAKKHPRGAAVKGSTKSDEYKRKMSETMKGRVFSEEHKRRLSESHKGKSTLRPKFRWITPEGSVIEMAKCHVRRYRPDWKLIKEEV